MTASKVQYARGWRKRKDVKTMKKSDGGKGSSPRPYSVSQDEYAKRWDAIFGRDLEAEEETVKTLADLQTIGVSWSKNGKRIDPKEVYLEEEHEETPEIEEDDESLYCVKCGGVDTMYKSPNGMHLICDQCGYAERVLSSEDY